MRHFSQNSYLRILGSGCAIFVLLASAFVTAHFSQARATPSLPIVNNPVIFLHGFNGGSAENCVYDWDRAIQVLTSSTNVKFTGPKIMLGYYKGDTYCAQNLSQKGSRGRMNCLGYDNTSEKDVGTNKESIRHLACELAWYIYSSYSRYGISVNMVAHSMGGLITRYALYAVQHQDQTQFKLFPSKLFMSNVIDFDTPNGGIPVAWNYRGVVNSFLCNNCLQAVQMEEGSIFILELYYFAQDPQTKGNVTTWTLLSSIGHNSCVDTRAKTVFAIPLPSPLDMNGKHIVKVVYKQPYYCHNGNFSMQRHSAIPNQPTQVQYCDGCAKQDAKNWQQWKSSSTFPDPLYEMLRVLSAQASPPVPTPSPTLSPTPLPAKRIIYYNTGTSITAYNTADGQQLWSVGSSTSDIVGDPVLTTINNQPSLLYIDNGTLHAVNPTSGSDLGITYSLNTFSLAAPPVISNGVIYISSNDSTGPHMNGFSTSCSTSCSPLWTVPMIDGLCNTPTISNNILYISECDPYIQAFDLTQNPPMLKWTYRISSGRIATPINVDSNEVIYFGMSGFYADSGAIRAIQPAYNSNTGTWDFNQLWNYQLTGPPDSLVFNNNILYFTSPCWSGTPNSGSSCGTNIDALHTNDGSTLWPEKNTPIPAKYTSPSGVFLANNSLYFGTWDGVYSLDATTGNQNWHVLSGINGIFSTPLVAGNDVFIGSTIGLYDLSTSGGSQQRQLSSVSNSGLFQGLAVN